MTFGIIVQHINGKDGYCIMKKVISLLLILTVFASVFAINATDVGAASLASAPTITQPKHNSGRNFDAIYWNKTTSKAVKWQVFIWNPNLCKYEKLRKTIGTSFNFAYYYGKKYEKYTVNYYGSKYRYCPAKSGRGSNFPTIVLTVRGIDKKGKWCTKYKDFKYTYWALWA